MASKLSLRWRGQKLENLERSPFSRTEDGLADYRNAPVAALRQLEGLLLMDTDFSGADFSKMRLHAVRFANCRFDRADFTGVSEQDSLFDSCSFICTDWRVGHIGREHSQYRRSVFESPKLAKTNFYNPRFEECRFAGAWKGVDFNTSGFWGCEFAGNFEDIMFRGDYLYASERARYGAPRDTGLHNTSFTAAELHWVGLAGGCAVDRVEMPRSNNAFICDLPRLFRDEASLLDGAASELQQVLKKYLDVIRPGPVREGVVAQQLIIVSRHDLVSVSRSDVLGGAAYDRLHASAAVADPTLVH